MMNRDEAREALVSLAVRWLEWMPDHIAEETPELGLANHFRLLVRELQPPGSGLAQRLCRPKA